MKLGYCKNCNKVIFRIHKVSYHLFVNEDRTDWYGDADCNNETRTRAEMKHFEEDK